jgi:hypothetical protein
VVRLDGDHAASLAAHHGARRDCLRRLVPRVGFECASVTCVAGARLPPQVPGHAAERGQDWRAVRDEHGQEVRAEAARAAPLAHLGHRARPRHPRAVGVHLQ